MVGAGRSLQVGNGKAQDVTGLAEPRGGECRHGDCRLDRRLEHANGHLAGGNGNQERLGGRGGGDERGWAELAAQDDLAAGAARG